MNGKAFDATEAASAASSVSSPEPAARDYGAEFDALKSEVAELKEHVTVLRKVVHGPSVS